MKNSLEGYYMRRRIVGRAELSGAEMSHLAPSCRFLRAKSRGAELSVNRGQLPGKPTDAIGTLIATE